MIETVIALFGGKIGGILAAAFVLFIGVRGYGFSQRRKGAAEERARVAKQEAKARTIADEIDDAVAGREPAKNRQELKRW